MRTSGYTSGMTDVKITVRPNGPYLVKGPIALVDGDGNPFHVEEGKTIALCRCGGSTTKPFCDGTHSRTGFAAATNAVADEEAVALQGPAGPGSGPDGSGGAAAAAAADVDGDPESPGS